MRRTSRFAVLGLGALLVGALGAAPASASEGPPVTPDTRQVMVVGNNWDGTVDMVDPVTYQVLRSVNVIPDLEQRLAEIRSNPVRLGYFLAIRELVGEGNDQYADDSFSSHDGKQLYVSRPSLADVVSIDVATGQIVWRFPMEGQRSDHMGISPDGTRLVVSDSTANKAHVLDPKTGAKVAEFASGDTPHESNFTEDGKRLFHASIGRVFTPVDGPVLDTSKGERYLQIVDTATWQFDRRDLADNLAAREGVVVGQGGTAGGGSYPDNSAIRPMAVSPDEKTLYLQLSFFHGYVVYDVASAKITQVVNLPNLVPDVPREQYLLDSAHHGLAVNPEGTQLCAAGTMNDYAAIVPVAQPTAPALVRGIVKPYWSTNGPDGRQCWVSASGSDEVVVIDYATAREVTRIPVGKHPQRIRVGLLQRSLVGSAAAPPAGAPPAAAPPAAAAPAPAAAAPDSAPDPRTRSLPATGAPLALPAVALLLGAAGYAVRRRRAR
jgi:YVTN family beta-propeller protein